VERIILDKRTAKDCIEDGNLTMNKLINTFKKSFGTSMPRIMLPKEEIFPLDNKNSKEAFLFGSKIARGKQFLIEGGIGSFIESAPKGYFLIGFWGHGVNSYAFYYSRVDSWSKIFFRLPYGGTYMDNEKMGKYVQEFLTSYFQFERRVKKRVKTLIAVESMGDGYYRIELPDGKSFELEESLFENAEFMKIFSVWSTSNGRSQEVRQGR
jgi:hypothetical protein